MRKLHAAARDVPAADGHREIGVGADLSRPGSPRDAPRRETRRSRSDAFLDAAAEEEVPVPSREPGCRRVAKEIVQEPDLGITARERHRARGDGPDRGAGEPGDVISLDAALDPSAAVDENSLASDPDVSRREFDGGGTDLRLAARREKERAGQTGVSTGAVDLNPDLFEPLDRDVLHANTPGGRSFGRPPMGHRRERLSRETRDRRDDGQGRGIALPRPPQLAHPERESRPLHARRVELFPQECGDRKGHFCLAQAQEPLHVPVVGPDAEVSNAQPARPRRDRLVVIDVRRGRADQPAETVGREKPARRREVQDEQQRDRDERRQNGEDRGPAATGRSRPRRCVVLRHRPGLRKRRASPAAPRESARRRSKICSARSILRKEASRCRPGRSVSRQRS
jgi:hypothetical protein